MTILFFIIAILATLHFVYEGIIGPSIRMNLRFRIFRQRDVLRLLKMKHNRVLSDQAFNSLHDSLNTAIRLLPAINIKTLMNAERAVDLDANLREEIARRDAMLKAIGLKEVDEIRKEIGKTVMLGLVVNTAGLFLYLVPIFMAIAFFRWTARVIKETLLIPGRQIDLILSLPMSENTNSKWCAQ